MSAVTESRLPLPLLRRGKVREVYEVDAGHLLLVASDRLSAFDVVLPTPIPDKGRVLTGVSRFWFEQTRDIIPNHILGTSPDDLPAGYTDAAGKAERQFARVMRAMLTELERVEQRGQRRRIGIRRDQPDVLFDRPPGEQPRLLEHHAQPAVRRTRDGTFEIRIEPGDDPQQRRLAATGRADQSDNLARPDAEGNATQHVQTSAGRRDVRLARDADLKPPGFASG